MQLLSKWNKGYRYLLMVLDLFSKYGWIVPLKVKKKTNIMMRRWNHNVILFRGISRFLSAVCRRWFPGQSGNRKCLVLYKRLVICFARSFQLLPSTCTNNMSLWHLVENFSHHLPSLRPAKFDLHVVRSTRPDIVIVQLSTNDLPFQPPLQVGSELEDFVRLLHNSNGVNSFVYAKPFVGALLLPLTKT